ncbi:MAG TPA: DedA family protein [Pyrinomonadaceae bacterium]|nr:DedA family protein [Pyrinomonadaceae bacterium]
MPTLLSFIINFAFVAMLAANDLSGSFDKNLAVRFLSKYGYFAILVAAFWEGEAVLITAGTLCGAGYLDWRLTILAAAIGGSAGDQIYFYAAHERAARAINKSKRLRRWYPKISKFVLRHSTIAVLLSRFAAGLRITIPLVCATAGMPAKKYSTLNLVSGFAWASFWVAITYQIGVHMRAG